MIPICTMGRAHCVFYSIPVYYFLNNKWGGRNENIHLRYYGPEERESSSSFLQLNNGYTDPNFVSHC